jgi:hypothetical protein
MIHKIFCNVNVLVVVERLEATLDVLGELVTMSLNYLLVGNGKQIVYYFDPMI